MFCVEINAAGKCIIWFQSSNQCPKRKHINKNRKHEYFKNKKGIIIQKNCFASGPHMNALVRTHPVEVFIVSESQHFQSQFMGSYISQTLSSHISVHDLTKIMNYTKWFLHKTWPTLWLYFLATDWSTTFAAYFYWPENDSGYFVNNVLIFCVPLYLQ